MLVMNTAFSDDSCIRDHGLGTVGEQQKKTRKIDSGHLSLVRAAKSVGKVAYGVSPGSLNLALTGRGCPIRLVFGDQHHHGAGPKGERGPCVWREGLLVDANADEHASTLHGGIAPGPSASRLTIGCASRP